MISVYLKPNSVFPDALPSNTIFGAMCKAMAELGMDVDDLIEVFTKRPPFLLSSAFPFVDSSDLHHFLPKPITKPARIDIEKHFDDAKVYKKARYIHQTIFNKWVKGETDEEEIIKSFSEYNQKHGLLYEKEIDIDFAIEQIEIPHNRIDRLSSESKEFYFTTGKIFKNAGLYFIIKFNDESYREDVLSALRFLQDRGFGGGISRGYGGAKIEIKDLDFIEESRKKYLMTLSRYIAVEFSEFKDDVWYELVTVRGRSGDGVMKKEVKMLSEGSVFPDIGKEVYGRIEEVRDDIPAVEYGLAFPVGIEMR